jgi:hypothetical protein
MKEEHAEARSLARLRNALLDAALRHLGEKGEAAAQPVRQLLAVFLENILEGPHNAVLRRVRLTHPQIAEMLGSDPAVRLVFELVGFAVAPSGEFAVLSEEEALRSANLGQMIKLLAPKVCIEEWRLAADLP